jgi:diguanylate cyclase (GGDEF)-like protein
VDLKTYVFFDISLALYAIVLASMALTDKRLVGARWLAYSIGVELVKSVLQGMAGSIPRVLSTMVANELNIVAYFTMFLGFRWFVAREPLRSRAGPIALLAVMAIYSGMFFLHVPYAFPVVGAPVLWICGATVLLMLRQKEERFRLPAQITASFLLLQMSLLLYRMVLSVEIYHYAASWKPPLTDLRWVYSMLMLALISNCLILMYLWFAAAEMYSTVEATAGVDALTGCLNRRSLMKIAAQEIARSDRSGMPLSIVMVDIDHFKAVNDTYGHGGGDAVLCALVPLLKENLRSVDVVARTGGEEFLLLLPDCDAIDAAAAVEELRQSVEQMQVEYEGRAITVTISAGVTQRLPRSDSWTAMVNRADTSMYTAKSTGRNRTCVDEQAVSLPRRPVAVAALVPISDGTTKLRRKHLG